MTSATKLITIPNSSLGFLDELKKHNEREWFNARKSEFLEAQGLIENFATQMLAKLNMHDVIETASGKKSLYRQYRDIRFAKDKTPFKTYWGGSFKRAGKSRRGGYYYHFEKGNSFVAGAFWGPSAADLKLIREDIDFDAKPLRTIISSTSFIENFGGLQGEQLKTSPKGFESNHPEIDLLRYKQFLLIRRFSDQELLSDDFALLVDESFREMRPFFDYMSSVLTADGNGL
ncbi:DUF2461 domain-containing protein [Pedobacter sp. MC2016-24]|uniref:DUF2461 domain-containing protein n=1 Tax=Pedobacter sp. MC2016-24 TaxID=2780090 RepID=UPI001881EBFA|nr:DUF2461 domain-containing protein [Pedobacter sp. MC2016-24]MBE9600818.1 DUF2461 domain-containing protein [Pedobacter sp. MC2016-24]